MSLQLITAPATEPVTLAEAKAHLRVTTVDDDTLITALIVAARQTAENMTDRALITQTWEKSLDVFPEAIELPKPRIQSITSVKYIDTAGVEQTLAGTEYLLDAASEPGWVTPAYDKAWPETRAVPNAVKVRYVAGYGATAADVPQIIRHAILLIIGELYERRENAIVGVVIGVVPFSAMALLSPYRIVRF